MSGFYVFGEGEFFVNADPSASFLRMFEHGRRRSAEHELAAQPRLRRSGIGPLFPTYSKKETLLCELPFLFKAQSPRDSWPLVLFLEDQGSSNTELASRPELRRSVIRLFS